MFGGVLKGLTPLGYVHLLPGASSASCSVCSFLALRTVFQCFSRACLYLWDTFTNSFLSLMGTILIGSMSVAAGCVKTACLPSLGPLCAFVPCGAYAVVGVAVAWLLGCAVCAVCTCCSIFALCDGPSIAPGPPKARVALVPFG